MATRVNRLISYTGASILLLFGLLAPIGGMFKLCDGVVERIISLTAGKPYLIQKICISLVTRLHEQHRRKITIADVEAVGRPEAA